MRAPLTLSLLLSACAPLPPAVGPVAPQPIVAVDEAPWRVGRPGAAARPFTQTRALAIKNATLLLGTGKRLERGTIVLDKGLVAAVGGADTAIPDGAEVIDGTGMFVTPGLIDTHSHMGVYAYPASVATDDGNEMVDPVTAHVRSEDGFWPQDPALMRAVMGGTTTIQVLPGSANLIGGRATTLKLRDGESVRDLHFDGAPDGLKMACGENPKRTYGGKERAPRTRMGNIAGQRSAFLHAKKLIASWDEYREAEQARRTKRAKQAAKLQQKKLERAQRGEWCDANGDPDPCGAWRAEWRKEPLEEPDKESSPPPPPRDLGQETLAGAIEGKILVHIHCYRADEMATMMDLAAEMGFRIASFHHALEAYKIRDRLAKDRIGVSTWADWWGFKLEAFDGIPENAAMIQESGGLAIIHSDSAEGVQRLNQEAAKALASGQRAGIKLSEDDAIQWVTKNPAIALGVDRRVGTLEVGKDADVVMWDKSPFSVYARAVLVTIDGEKRFVASQATQPWSDFEAGAPPPTWLGPPTQGGAP